jgi:hypothetical protein
LLALLPVAPPLVDDRLPMTLKSPGNFIHLHPLRRPKNSPSPVGQTTFGFSGPFELA